MGTKNALSFTGRIRKKPGFIRFLPGNKGAGIQVEKVQDIAAYPEFGKIYIERMLKYEV